MFTISMQAHLVSMLRHEFLAERNIQLIASDVGDHTASRRRAHLGFTGEFEFATQRGQNFLGQTHALLFVLGRGLFRLDSCSGRIFGGLSSVFGGCRSRLLF